MRIHTWEKPYQCRQCNEAFSYNSVMINHMRFHTGKRPFQCCHCDEAFSSNIVVIYHIRIHTDEKPYQCNQCDKAFSDIRSLIIHMRIRMLRDHIGAVIVTRYSQKMANLLNHMRIYTWEKVHQCNQCDKEFSQNS